MLANNVRQSSSANTRLLALTGVLVLGAVAALMSLTTSAQPSYSGLDQLAIKKDMFAQWKLAHGKSYAAAEEENRFQIWSRRYDWVQQHNQIAGNTYKVGMTIFSDMTNDEFKAQTTASCDFTQNSSPNYQSLPVGTNPTSVDWRQKNAVTEVKNQQQCGSCWSFSSTGSLEGLNAITNGKLISFSEQQLVDCSDSYGNQGCSGGLMDNAFKYVAAKGIEPSSVYPYDAEDGTCKYKESATVFKNTAFTDVPQNNNAQLETAVAQQPVSIGIEADSEAFQAYTSGVFNDASCGTNLDHGVLIVGYGTDNGQDYWIVKNSWGASWGEQGYIRIAKTSATGPGICGLATSASYPTVTSAKMSGFENSEEATEENTEVAL